MDAFEELAADIFWSKGYWVRNSVKVELTREDKARIGRPSSPRWEIDLVAYSPARNELLALECKSYFDSGGVHASHFERGSKYAHRYKLFQEEVLRETVLARLKRQFVAAGFCPPNVEERLGLVHGHATAHNAALLGALFERNDWALYGPTWIRAHVAALARGSYENSTAAIVAKLLVRRGRTEPIADRAASEGAVSCL